MIAGSSRGPWLTNGARCQEYSKHAALNFGLAARGLLQAANGLFYALVPPHWHHTPEDLEQLHEVSHATWFLRGFLDEKGSSTQQDEVGGYGVTISSGMAKGPDLSEDQIEAIRKRILGILG